MNFSDKEKVKNRLKMQSIGLSQHNENNRCTLLIEIQHISSNIKTC